MYQEVWLAYREEVPGYVFSETPKTSRKQLLPLNREMAHKSERRETENKSREEAFDGEGQQVGRRWMK